MNFEGLTLAELKDMAKEKGVKNISKLKKEELIVALSNKETDKVEYKFFIEEIINKYIKNK